ncbi:MAG: hypothetical protein QM601_02410 [Pseudoxanthomonas sp.]
MTGLPVDDAARALGVSSPTLRRWVGQGCPRLRAGHRGRGHTTLFDLGAVRAWQAGRGGQQPDVKRAAADALLAFVVELPDLLAVAAADAHQAMPDKRDAAFALCAAWQLAVNSVQAKCRRLGVEMPEVETRPVEIERLRKLIKR